MKIGVGNDHAGPVLKAAIAEQLRAAGHEVIDHTPGPPSPDDDYPMLVIPLARAVAAGSVERGVFCCGSGIGPAVAANKIPGVRATVATEEWSARDAVEHVDVNLLTLGERVIGVELAKAVVDAFVGAEPQGGRHARRREQIAELEVERT
ncbi:MAG: RpiB/LacA/LacB family sugar-phosphate isomerase [Chloroflexota bacterium]|nr:RpiB/LacA/LacB family sugar-phosphate isomerase [Chloroflexota bacterium]